MCVGDKCRCDGLNRIKDRLLKHAESAMMSFRTASLWVQLIHGHDIYILRKSVRAARTGNWALHIQPIQDMPHYISASGHNRYTKSARVYLQQMATLKEEHPDVHSCVEWVAHVSKKRLLVGRSVMGSNH